MRKGVRQRGNDQIRDKRVRDRTKLGNAANKKIGTIGKKAHLKAVPLKLFSIADLTS